MFNPSNLIAYHVKICLLQKLVNGNEGLLVKMMFKKNTSSSSKIPQLTKEYSLLSVSTHNVEGLNKKDHNLKTVEPISIRNG